ncbi:MAG: TonB-dependent receptor, partial [Deltaproteobacteria bacterium]|nr:TonB-dependent receptor [Deltaproteobacteria bacterium]
MLALALSVGAVVASILGEQDAVAADNTTAPAKAGSEIELLDLDLEEVLRMKVSTASGGIEEESDLAPANVFTISRSEIASQGWRSVAQALEHVPGLYVVDDLVSFTVGVRGANGGLRAGS